jgi:uncharacterized cofD-like protein
MSAISGGFDAAIANCGEVLAIRGKVLPVTLSSITLNAELENGKQISGESAISKAKEKIKNVFLTPFAPPAAPEVLNALKNADIIIFGPGSLYTSVIVNLLVDGVVEAIKSSKAYKIYVSNIMTQPNETTGYSLLRHIEALERHSYKGIIDCILANKGRVPKELARRYRKHGARQVIIDKTGIKTIKSDLFSNETYARHDCDKLGKALMKAASKIRGKING